MSKIFFRVAFLVGALGVLSFGPTRVSAADINSTFFGNKAIKGYDPVAYFKQGRPLKGDPQFTFTWEGANWIFSSKENLDAFKADPAKYAPAYGGYCAYAAASGDKVGIDPDAWSIVNDRLFLNYNQKVQEKWEADRDRYIEAADKHWSAR